VTACDEAASAADLAADRRCREVCSRIDNATCAFRLVAALAAVATVLLIALADLV